MPKMKTRRAVAKRFRLTARGKMKRARAFRSHLLSGKNRKRKRRLRHPDLISQADWKRIRLTIPYA